MTRESERRQRLLIVILSIVVTALACSQSGTASLSGVRSAESRRLDRGAPARRTPAATDAGAILATHNRVRAEVGVGPLEWSPEIAASAQLWADRLAAAESLEHSSGPYGENLWSGTAGAYSQGEQVESWASEQRDFVPGKVFPKGCRRDWSECGHYTQIVWRATRRVGCGHARGRNADYLVCRYEPPGNVVGEIPY